MKRAARIAVMLGPDGSLTVLALASLTLAIALLGGEFVIPRDTVVPYLIVAALLMGASATVDIPLLLGCGDRHRFVRRQARAARVWLPFVVLYMCYRALRGTLLVLVPHDGVHDTLKRWDEALLGVSPAWWMEQFATPWLTELMAYAYATMFFLPMVVLVALYARHRDRALREAALALLCAFYLGFALFLLVPAKSPDIVYSFGTELSGYGFYEASTQAWRRLQQVTFDAFPSMHTAISTLALVHAHRHGAAVSRRWPRLAFRLFVPVVVALQIATLYLRQHYFVDLLAAWVVAWVSLVIAARLERAWPEP